MSRSLRISHDDKYWQDTDPVWPLTEQWNTPMNSMTAKQLSALTQELSRLRRAVAQEPCPSNFGRLAELEGMLAAYRDEQAWDVTRDILARLDTRT